MEELAEFFKELSSGFTTMLERMNVDVGKLTEVLSYDPAQPLLFNTGLFLVLFAVFMFLF